MRKMKGKVFRMLKKGYPFKNLLVFSFPLPCSFKHPKGVLRENIYRETFPRKRQNFMVFIITIK